jgi:putative heme iron utilization protein
VTDTDLVRAARALVASVGWLAVATSDLAGDPAAGYFPFVPLKEGFGIVASGLAAHTQHLLAHPRVALLILGNNAPGDDFARPRLSVDASAYAVTEPREVAEIWNAFERSELHTAEVLRTLPDFRPFVLLPIRARMILGFGQAGDVTGHALLG